MQAQEGGTSDGRPRRRSPLTALLSDYHVPDYILWEDTPHLVKKYLNLKGKKNSDSFPSMVASTKRDFDKELAVYARTLTFILAEDFRRILDLYATLPSFVSAYGSNLDESFTDTGKSSIAPSFDQETCEAIAKTQWNQEKAETLKSLQQARQDIKSIFQEREDALAAKTLVESRNAQLVKEIEAMANELDVAKADREQLERDCALLQAGNTDLQKNLVESESAKRQLERQLDDNRSGIKQLEDTVASQRELIENLRGLIVDLEIRIHAEELKKDSWQTEDDLPTPTTYRSTRAASEDTTRNVAPKTMGREEEGAHSAMDMSLNSSKIIRGSPPIATSPPNRRTSGASVGGQVVGGKDMMRRILELQDSPTRIPRPSSATSVRGRATDLQTARITGMLDSVSAAKAMWPRIDVEEMRRQLEMHRELKYTDIHPSDVLDQLAKKTRGKSNLYNYLKEILAVYEKEHPPPFSRPSPSSVETISSALTIDGGISNSETTSSTPTLFEEIEHHETIPSPSTLSDEISLSDAEATNLELTTMTMQADSLLPRVEEASDEGVRSGCDEDIVPSPPNLDDDSILTDFGFISPEPSTADMQNEARFRYTANKSDSGDDDDSIPSGLPTPRFASDALADEDPPSHITRLMDADQAQLLAGMSIKFSAEDCTPDQCSPEGEQVHTTLDGEEEADVDRHGHDASISSQQKTSDVISSEDDTVVGQERKVDHVVEGSSAMVGENSIPPFWSFISWLASFIGLLWLLGYEYGFKTLWKRTTARQNVDDLPLTGRIHIQMSENSGSASPGQLSTSSSTSSAVLEEAPRSTRPRSFAEAATQTDDIARRHYLSWLTVVLFVVFFAVFVKWPGWCRTPYSHTYVETRVYYWHRVHPAVEGFDDSGWSLIRIIMERTWREWRIYWEKKARP